MNFLAIKYPSPSLVCVNYSYRYPKGVDIPARGMTHMFVRFSEAEVTHSRSAIAGPPRNIEHQSVASPLKMPIIVWSLWLSHEFLYGW